MINYIITASILVLVILGLTQLIRIVSMWIFCPRRDIALLTIVPVKEHTEDIEFLLRGAMIRMCWLGYKNSRVIAVDCGTDNETREICRRMEKNNPTLIFCSLNELSVMVNSGHICACQEQSKENT